MVSKQRKAVNSGYSGTPLTKKLGIKEKSDIAVINQPQNFLDILSPLPEKVSLINKLSGRIGYIHFFTKSKKELTDQFPELKKHLDPSGSLWISWPKKSSKIETDLDENLIREIGLKNGMVDVKVCAIDETWSGLKFVLRLKDR
jgi:hypothetical protein